MSSSSHMSFWLLEQEEIHSKLRNSVSLNSLQSVEAKISPSSIIKTIVSVSDRGGGDQGNTLINGQRSADRNGEINSAEGKGFSLCILL